ncbi:hypothetical protein [Cellulosimicrobium cellulans]|uniref:hypothetical protein n=1 Tax=Cellulosimicrobium cellulans TaxID=1710 RepID=UPI001BA5326D|nr:hypothetical protein [Cellulosimicrobium cellulans]QUC01110.1 hypothetical protein J5A69_08050 [Cellulosimicrobium cellulans]
MTATTTTQLARAARRMHRALSVYLVLVYLVSSAALVCLGYAWGHANGSRTAADAPPGATAGTTAERPAQELVGLVSQDWIDCMAEAGAHADLTDPDVQAYYLEGYEDVCTEYRPEQAQDAP